MHVCSSGKCCARDVQIVREKLFKRLYKELPYRLDIVDAAVNVHRDGSIRVEKHIMVPDRNVSDTPLCWTAVNLQRSSCVVPCSPARQV